jgi:hypothetical protein
VVTKFRFLREVYSFKDRACKGHSIITPVIFFVPKALVFRIVEYGSLELSFFRRVLSLVLRRLKSPQLSAVGASMWNLAGERVALSLPARPRQSIIHFHRVFRFFKI